MSYDSFDESGMIVARPVGSLRVVGGRQARRLLVAALRHEAQQAPDLGEAFVFRLGQEMPDARLDVVDLGPTE